MLPLFALGSCLAVQGQDIAISSLAGNGQLTFTNSFTNALYTIEWAPALGTNWRQNWGPLQGFWAPGRTSAVQVPMFYRVKCVTDLLFPFPVGREAVFSASDAVGNVWTEKSVVLSYIHPLGADRPQYALLEQVNPNSLSFFMARSTDTAMIRLDPDRLVEVTEFQLGPVGTTWTNFNYKGQYTRKVTIEAIETVTVPAGTFPACYKFHKQIVSGSSSPRPEWYEWVRPGFSMVKWVDYWCDNAPNVHELWSLSTPAP